MLGPLHQSTAHQRLTRLEFLTPDRTVRRATYGEGEGATTVVVNFGQHDASVDAPLGGTVLLPPWGFVIESPRFAAFYARKWGGRDYPHGALFTVRVVEGDRLRQAARLRVFHGFGDPTIAWQDATYKVPREQILTPGT